MEIITRTQSKEQGLKRYFTGIPCKHGHISERNTNSGRCIMCGNLYVRSQTGLPGVKEKRTLLSKSWRYNNPTRALELAQTPKSKAKQKEWTKGRGRINRLISNCKVRAKQRELEFNLSVSDINIPPICPVLGIPLMFSSDKSDNTPTIDRVNNSKGYTVDNIRIISFRANRLKSDASITELQQIITYMEQHEQQK